MNSKRCTVRGTFALVLKVSRIFGVAPLRFEKIRNGYRATVSYYYAIYSYIYVTCLNAILIMALSMEQYKRAIETKTPLNLAYVLPDLITASMSASFGGYYGLKRMKNMIIYLNRLDKVRMNIDDKSDTEKMKNKDKLSLIIIISYAAFVLTFQVMKIHNLIVNFKSDQNKYVRFMKSKHICILSSAYVTVCDIISAMNRTEGGIILVIFTNFVITLITTFYYGILVFWELPIQLIIWGALYLFRVMVFIETCHVISSEVTKINVNLDTLIQKTTNVGERIHCELKLMFKQLMLNKPNYSPMEVFTPERSIIITISSAVITYVLFMMQLKK